MVATLDNVEAPMESLRGRDVENPIAVICGASATGLGVARDLGGHGVQIVFADLEPYRPGFASRYCSRLHGSIHAPTEEELIERLLEFGARQTVRPVLFQTTDQLVLAVADHRQKLGQYYVIADSSREGLADVVTDKKSFYALCVKHGVVVPKTMFPLTLSEAEASILEFEFPVIVKPIHGHLWRERLKGKKLLVAGDRNGFDRILKQFGEQLGDLMIQEMIPGPEKNLWVAGIYLRQSDGHPGAVFTGRKLRQFPPGFGSASLADACENSEVKRISLEFLKQIGYRGVCGTEFKFDERDGQYKMVEVNPRQTLWFALIGASGVPLNYYAYCDLAGIPVPREASQRDGTKWILFEKDFVTALGYFVRGKLGLLAWLRSYRNVRVHAVASCSDPRPMLGLVKTYFVRVFRRFVLS